VTGATGTVGSEVVKQLAAISSSSGYNVRATVHSKNKSDQLIQLESEGVEVIDLEYTKPETIEYALNNVDKLFLQTLPSPNVADICSNIINRAKKNGVKYVVKLSAMGANSEPGSTVLRLHGEEGKIIEDSGIPYTFLRPTAFMQNFVTQFGHTIKTQNAFYVPAEHAKMSFIDSRNIASVTAEILTKNNSESSRQHYENKAYDITGPDALSYGQAANILSSVAGKKISYVNITEEDARKGMKQIGMGDWFIDIMIELLEQAMDQKRLL
jgi:uncharacterized protein YbjT (DUF2867 family)